MKSENNDTRLNVNEIPPATHNGHALVDGEASEDPIDVAAARFGLSRRKAEEIFQFFDETMNSGDQMLRGSLAQAVSEAMRERDKQWVLWLGKIFSVVDIYTARQKSRKFIRATLLTTMFALGYGDEAGVSSFAGIALKMKMKGESGKQTVTKYASLFLDKLKLAPMFTQRTQAARENMTAARLDQIIKN